MPDRAVVLLRSNVTGELVPAVVRVAEGISAEDIRLSKTLVAAVVEKKNGLSPDGHRRPARGVSLSESIRLSGIKSGAGGAAGERRRGRRADLRGLSGWGTAPSRKRTCAS
mgnify:CR=1 FL=1